MNDDFLFSLFEALLFVSPAPIKKETIRIAIESELDSDFEEKFSAFLKRYNYQNSGLQIVEVAGGYQMVTRAPYAPYIKKMHTLQTRARLSRAALEALAIIAYQQPITVPEIEFIRGVDCSGVIKNLLEKNLITILGRRKGIGNPILYGTTSHFLVEFGLQDLKSLPSLEEFEKTMAADNRTPGIGPEQNTSTVSPSGDQDPGSSETK